MPTGYVHLFIYGSKSDMIVRCLSVRNNVFVKNNPFSGIRIFIVVIVLATSSTLSTLIPILLNTVIMPEHLTTTGSGTFMDSPLSSITLPKNLTSIDDNAFNGCGGKKPVSKMQQASMANEAGFDGE